MKIDGLNIPELIDVCHRTKGGLKKIPFKEINKYLYHRLESENWCSEVEMRELDKFVDELNRKLWDSSNTGQIKKLFKRINELVINSKEALEKEKKNSLNGIKADISLIDDKSIVLVLIKEFIEELEKEKTFSNVLIGKIDKIDKKTDIYMLDETFEILKRTLSWVEVNEKVVYQAISDNKKEAFKRKFLEFRKKIDKLDKNDRRIKKDLEEGKINLNQEEFSFNYSSLKRTDECLEVVKDRVITIDSYDAVALDGAFSIKKERDYYIFDVYVTDVATFLRDNRDLCINAYKRGTSISIKNHGKMKDIHLDILPTTLDSDYLSLKQNKLRSVIDFKFIILNDGLINSTYVSRKKVKVTDRLNYNRANELFNVSISNSSRVQRDLLLYKEMVEKVLGNTLNLYSKEMNVKQINDLFSFASILVNYYVGYEADFAIYRNDGKYIRRDGEHYYTHSVTPLRRFVSLINLAFLLNQNGEASFSEKDLRYVENNVDEIIEHLNEQDKLSEFVKKNSSYVKKYLK